MAKKDFSYDSNNEETTTVVDFVDTFQNATGLQVIRAGIKWVSIGAFMGTSDAIPGYSGGTTLALLGFYQKLIFVAKSIFIPEQGLTRIKALKFMIPFAFGWISGVFGFAKLTEALAHHGFGLELMFFFSAFILLAIPIFVRKEKPEFVELIPKSKQRGYQHIFAFKLTWSYQWWFFFLGMGVVIGLALWVFHNGGVTFNEREGQTNYYPLNAPNLFKLVGVAIVAGFVAIIPGGSGAIVQLVTNMYEHIHWQIMAHPLVNIWGLIIFAAATFIGMLTMIFVMVWGFKKHQKSLIALSFGMLLASISALLIVPDQETWALIKQLKHIIGVIVAWFLGASVAFTLNLYIKFRISQKLRKLNSH